MTARVPFVDLGRVHAGLESELEAAFARVLRSGKFILGDEVESFEAACAAALGARYAIGVSSGTDALLVALLALGIGAGAEVICPAYTFFATAGAIARTGARPVFVDVDPDALLLDASGVERALTPRTRAIVPVHLFGRCMDLESILELARERGIHVVEDAAQAFGAAFGGRSAGTRGTAGAFSFFPSKPLGALGDAGLVVTNDGALAQRIRALRIHGARTKHEHAEIGGNFRLDAMHAALLRVKLAHVARHNEARRAIAARYAAELETRGRIRPDGPLSLLAAPADMRAHVFAQFVVRVHGDGTRDALRAALAERGIETEVYYPTPLPLQPAFAALGQRPADFPAACAASRQTLALPIFPGLTDDEIAAVAAAIDAALPGRGLAERGAGASVRGSI